MYDFIFVLLQKRQYIYKINDLLFVFVLFSFFLGENYVSVSYVKPVLHKFKVETLQPDDDDTELSANMKTEVLSYLTEKYQDEKTQDLLDMASLVDPRFKTLYIDSDKTEKILARAVSELESLLSVPVPGEAQHPEAAAQPSTSAAQSTPQEETHLPKKKAKKSLASFLANSVLPAAGTPAPTLNEAIQGEIKSYLAGPNAPVTIEPLEWWQQHEPTFPRVSLLAKKYLCIQATSAPSERVFSTGGNIVTCQRAVLKPEKVDQLIFLARNL